MPRSTDHGSLIRIEMTSSVESATDQELIGYLDRRFGEISEKVDGLREELFDEVWLIRAAAEGLCFEIELLAESMMSISGILEARHSETLLKLAEVKASIGPLSQDLSRRVKVLEERAERQTRDVLDVIRERFGRSRVTST